MNAPIALARLQAASVELTLDGKQVTYCVVHTARGTEILVAASAPIARLEVRFS